MTTLITGANGFIGSALLRLLLDQGHTVRALIRPNADIRNLAGLEVDTITGDLTDPDSLQRAVKKCDALFHVAADYRLWAPDPAIIYKTNVTGTRQLMLAALTSGIKRIVYTSSVATLGFTANRTAADETTEIDYDNIIGHYKRSKYLAEQQVQQLVRSRQLPAVIVNPTAPVGPRDIKPTPTGRLILDSMRGRMPVYVNTGLNIVHVDDVANGHLLALENGVIGERYILGGDDLSLQQILRHVCLYTNRTPPLIRIPHNLILPVAWLMERLSQFSGKEPLVTVDGVRMSKKFMYYSSNKAKSALGYDPRPGTAGINDAIDWFNQHHYQ